MAKKSVSKKRPASRAAKTPPTGSARAALPEGLLDRLAIREVLENWVLYRDAGDWERFKGVWHEDGYMMATWFQGTHEEFAAISKAGMEKGVNILHFLGGCTVDIAGNRAISQTKMSIVQRAPVEGVLCDVTCVGRFYDFLEKRKEKWAIVLRRLFYEKDRIDPVDPSQTLKLDPAILQRYPVGYQHLAYLQAGLGFPVKTNMPGLRGPDADRLYALGRAWLDNKPLDDSFRI
jgi:SnoaL-like domain